ncbi:MAG: hypothetical protein AABO41_00720 [Acidobacteriota bacterium]
MLGDISACLAKLVSLVQESRGDGRDAYRDRRETPDTARVTQEVGLASNYEGIFENFEGVKLSGSYYKRNPNPPQQ